MYSFSNKRDRTQLAVGVSKPYTYILGGYALKVEQAEVLTYKQFLDKYNAEDEYSYVPDKIYDVEITLENIDAQDD